MYKVLFAGNSKECSQLEEKIKWNKIGYEVTNCVTHIYFALEIIKREHIDVMFVDLEKCSRFDMEFIREIRQLSKNIKIICIADKSSYETVGTSVKKDVSFLIKPLGKNEVLFAEKQLKEYKFNEEVINYLKYIFNDKSFEDEVLLNLSAKNYDYFNNLFKNLSKMDISADKKD